MLVQRHVSLLIFAVFSLIVLLFSTSSEREQTEFESLSMQKQEKVKIVQGSPFRLKIPRINVDAYIEYIGVTETGIMEVPDGVVNVGWFRLGPRPGEKGSAVIAGHLDGKYGEAGVFASLDKLKAGDKISVEDTKGSTTTFVVREINTYDPGYANSVFNASEGVHLNLITCDGAWDGAKKSYDKRLVVLSDIVR